MASIWGLKTIIGFFRNPSLKIEEEHLEEIASRVVKQLGKTVSLSHQDGSLY